MKIFCLAAALLLLLETGCGARIGLLRPPAVSTTASSGGGSVFAAEDFSKPTSVVLPNTCLGTQPPGEVHCDYLTGEYQLAVVDPNFDQGALVYPTLLLPPDVTVALDVHLANAGTALSDIWIRCRTNFFPPASAGAYSFGIQPTEGTFTLSRLDAGPGSSTSSVVNLLGSKRPQGPVHRGTASNHVELTCKGDAVTASINGIQVASVHDSTYASGRVQLGAGVPEGTTPGVVDARITKLVIRHP